MSNTESSDVSASEKSADNPAGSSPAPTRRNMLVETLTAFLSFVLVAVPAAIAGVFYLDPVLRRKKAAGATGAATLEGFVRLGVTKDVIPEDGTPVAVTVEATLDDAWNRFKDVPIGSVWLRKQTDGEIVAFNSICPHLGCSVDFRRGQGDFFCPCHTSSFDLDGKKTNQVPPRNMDSLEIVTVTDGAPSPDGNELWLKFQNFRGATEEKIPV